MARGETNVIEDNGDPYSPTSAAYIGDSAAVAEEATEARSVSQPAADYHADHTAWSRSMLSTFRRRRRLAEAMYVTHKVAGEPPTEEMILGTAIHTAVFEPDRLAADFVTIPRGLLASNGAASTNRAKDFIEEARAAGKTVVKQHTLDTVATVSASIRRVCGPWLDLPAHREESIYWTHPETGVRLKCRPDWLTGAGNSGSVVVLDLKTTTDASPWAFRKKCEDLGYWLQDVHYREGIGMLDRSRPVEFYFVVAEVQEPFACALYSLDDRALQAAERARRGILRDLESCLRTGNWDEPWEQSVTRLSLRPWAVEPETLC